MLIPETKLADIVSHCKGWLDFDFTSGEIQELCEEGGITHKITEGWPDTVERELFWDLLARKFTGSHWPTYAESHDEDDFAVRLLTGYYRWRWGDLTTGDFVLVDGQSYRVKATSFATPDEIVPVKNANWVELEGRGKVGLTDLFSRDENPPYEVIGDGNTVWVNNHEGVCLGRFSRYGIDIHNDLLGQQVGVQCLDCKPAESVHGGMDREDWERFKGGMLRFHNVLVTDSVMPEFLR